MTRAAALAVAVLVALPCFGGAPVYEFDGVNDAAKITSLSFGSAEVMTFSYWADIAEPSGGPIIMEQGTDYNNTDGGCIIYYAGGRLNAAIRGGISLGYRAESIPWTSDGWRHITICLDNSTTAGDVVFYVDGVEQATTIDLNTKNASGPIYSGDMYLMSRAATAVFLAGNIYSTKIHNRALSAAEVRGEYVAGGGRVIPAGSVVLPRANDESVVLTLDATADPANMNSGKVLAEDAVITSKDAARNYSLAKGGVTVGQARIATPAP